MAAPAVNVEAPEIQPVERQAHTVPAVAKRMNNLLSQANLEKRVEKEKTDPGSTGSSSMNNSGHKGLAGLMMMKRKVSKWKRGGGGAGSTMGSSVRSGPKMQLENSYRLGPDESQLFNEEKVKKVIEESIKLFMVKQSGYNPAKSAQVSRYLTDDIKTRIKQLNFKRYKYVVHVMIGQSNEQGMQYASRCVWDTKTDNSATVVHRHKDTFVVVNVFATYFE